MTHPPADDRERRLATTTFDRNVVVTAGAGTGKTTLLVERCINLLMREPEPVGVTEFIALTFTNKAANEMRARLRDRLEALAGNAAAAPAGEAAASGMQASGVRATDAAADEIQILCDRYRLTPDAIRDRAHQALAGLERAQISTIHSFAASLLRLYPLETGLDPGFREADERLLGKHFDSSWNLWLDGELSGAGPRTEAWKQVLARFPLERVAELALCLCAENLDLERIGGGGGAGGGGAPGGGADILDTWLNELEDEVKCLLERHPEKRNIEKALAAAQQVIRSTLDGDPVVAEVLSPEETSALESKKVRPKEWRPDEFDRACELNKAAVRLAQVDHDAIDRLCDLLAPFARQCRADFTRKGLVTFDGLLVRARDLLRDRPRVHGELKERYKSILVDEFQDTDPLQYEILLWLCEDRSRRAAAWRDIRLAPGKLFVVGDPKQSIYGFRGADIEAYLKIVQEVIEAQGGSVYRLTANFRSDARILRVVNGVFSQLIQEKPGLQPEYIALHPGRDAAAAATGRAGTGENRAETDPAPDAGDGTAAPSDASAAAGRARAAGRTTPERDGPAATPWDDGPEPGAASTESEEPWDGPGSAAVQVRRVTTTGQKLDAAAARQLEAKSLARWLAEEILGRDTFRDRDGNLVPARPGHVAFLLRALTHVQVYLEALRSRGIGYVVEGERDFYAAPEVVDAVNLLRAIDNPHDRLALVGVLRSPLGGHSDLEVHALNRERLLSYRRAESRRREDLPPPTLHLYRQLHRLHREVRFLGAAQAVERVFRELPLSVLAASSAAGEQAIANLEKLRLAVEEAGAEGSGTLKDVIAELERRVLNRMDEPESPLEEATPEAVRIMSIHRAKGLEFPIVVLADALAGTPRDRLPDAEVRRDWATGMTGVRLEKLSNLAGVHLDAKRRLQEAHERRRLLYVAMTRPRERLVVSFAERGKNSSAPRDSLLAMLDEATGANLLRDAQGMVRCGPGAMEVTVVMEDTAANERVPQRTTARDTDDWTWCETLWRRRREGHETRLRTPLFLTPTRLKAAGEADEAAADRTRPGSLERGAALNLGTLAHRVLEHWDFRADRVEEALEQAVAWHGADLPAAQREAVVRELRGIWRTFTRSAVYDEIRAARILGRETPFVMPWNGQVMEGVIDLVYERDGRLYVADYKTDQVADADGIDRIVDQYRHQAEVYTEAVRQGLDRPVDAFRLILLRLGRAVDVPAGAGAPTLHDA